RRAEPTRSAILAGREQQHDPFLDLGENRLAERYDGDLRKRAAQVIAEWSGVPRMDQLGRQDQGQAPARPQKRDGMRDEVSPRRGEPVELHAGARRTLQGFTPGTAGELLITDV